MEINELEDFKDIHISYKTAKLAQQKNFYCICPHHFIDEEIIVGGWLGHAKPEPSKEDIQKYINDPHAWPIASTQQILREWIERNLKLSVFVVPEYRDKENFYVGCILNKVTLKIKKLANYFPKYSEAMEDGLFSALQ